MRAMRAEQFSGYEGLKLVDLPKPVLGQRRQLRQRKRMGHMTSHWLRFAVHPVRFRFLMPLGPQNDHVFNADTAG